MKRTFFLFSFYCWRLALVSLTPLPMHGQTQPSLPISEQSSRNSGKHLTEWNSLSTKFGEILKKQSDTLKALEEELTTSKNGLAQLTALLDSLSAQNESLKTYNAQIAERMQERDEDLAQAYADIDRLQKDRLRLILACAVLGIALFLFFGLRAVRFI